MPEDPLSTLKKLDPRYMEEFEKRRRPGRAPGRLRELSRDSR
jgi:hypothetical protein